MMRFSDATSASVTRSISPLLVIFAAPRCCISRLPASRAICVAKLRTGGPRFHFTRRSHFLRSDLENVRDLLVPVGPRVIARQFAKLVRDLFVEHHLREIAIRAENRRQRVFGAAVEIEIRQR